MGTTRSLRILILSLHYSPEPTGNAPYVASLAAGLVGLGHTVQVVTSHPHYPEWKVRSGYGQWALEESIDGVPVKRLKHYVPAAPTGGKRLLAELTFGLRLLGTGWHRPDIVLLVSPGLFSSAVASVRAWIQRIPRAVWVQDLYSLGLSEVGDSGPAVEAVVRAVEGLTLRTASGVAVIHERFARQLTTNFRVEGDRVRVLRNWTHLKPLPAVDRASGRLALGWADTDIVALHAGNMGVKQGLENLIEAARIARAEGHATRFVLMGDGNQRSSLEQLAKGVPGIEFLDLLPDAEFQAALICADVLIVNENSGLSEMSVPSKLTSYFDSGRPVLAATDASSVTSNELAASGAGIRVNPGDPVALVQSLVALAADPVLAAQLGRNGRLYREKVLDSGAAIGAFADWLAEVADGGAHLLRSGVSTKRQDR